MANSSSSDINMAECHFAPQPDSALLSKLPREIRDEIWSHTVLSSDITDQHGNSIQYIKHNKQALEPLSILHVCRQTRSEARNIYYSNTVFLDSSFDQATDLSKLNAFAWLRSLDPSARKQIKSLALVDFCSPPKGEEYSIRPLFFNPPNMFVTTSSCGRDPDALRNRLCEEATTFGVGREVVRFLKGNTARRETGLGKFWVYEVDVDGVGWKEGANWKLWSRDEEEPEDKEDDELPELVDFV